LLFSGYPILVWPSFGILDFLSVPLWVAYGLSGLRGLVLAFDGLDLFVLDYPGVSLRDPVISFDWIWLGLNFLAE